MRKPIFALCLLAGLASADPLARIDVVPQRAASAPVRLTSSDGQGLRLTRYHAKVVVQGPLAFTELHLTFHNPQDRVLEGRFEIALPEGAALSRLAMKNEKGWQEAEVVELQQARRAYEDFLHRRQDPALLEKQAGNQFQARIFPIPSGGDKELILSYSHELDGHYRLPVSGLPRVDQLSLEALVSRGEGASEKLSYNLQGEAPKGDFVITAPAGVSGMTNGQDVLLVVRPEVKNASAAPAQDLLVLVDTSASRAAGYSAQVATVRSLLREWCRRHPTARVRLAAFDQAVVPLAEGNWPSLQSGLNQLASRRPLGATNLRGALAWAGRQPGYQRLLLVSDGVSTLDSRGLGLAARLRLDAVMVGGIRDSAALSPLVNGHGGFLLGSERPAAELASRLEQRPFSGLKVGVTGADWVWPARLDGLAPGQQRVVYAHLSAPAREAQVTLGSVVYRQPLSPVAAPLLRRSVTAANLARLHQQWRHSAGSAREKIARHMIELSTGQRVVCDLTGLLVLETEADYQRFQIDRRALSDILVAGAEGVEVQKREELVVSPTSDEPQPISEFQEAEKLRQPVSGGEGLQDVTAGDQLSKRRESSGPVALAGKSSPVDKVEEEPTTRRPPPVLLPRPEVRVVRPPSVPRRTDAVPARQPSETEDGNAPALNGTYKQIDTWLRAGKTQQALRTARQWQAREPGDVLALVGLGRSLQAVGQSGEAARAYGSIIDLYPGRADLRRYAGGLLESLGGAAQAVALDSFAQAVSQRPDHPSGARMLAYAHLRSGRPAQAYQVLVKALSREYPGGRFAGVDEVLRDDLGIAAAVLIARDPDQRPRVLKELHRLGVALAKQPSLRFVLTWETDANDVDFHIQDSQGGHAYYSQPDLPSGGRLYDDVTTGYGPECFAIPGGGRAFPYRISIHYYSRGPMGYGMGKVEVVRHDGRGGLRFEQRPFVVMNDSAYVDLGLVKP